MPFSVFISYSHQDRAFRKELETHLSNAEETERHYLLV